MESGCRCFPKPCMGRAFANADIHYCMFSVSFNLQRTMTPNMIFHVIYILRVVLNLIICHCTLLFLMTVRYEMPSGVFSAKKILKKEYMAVE
jgi:hypothetical protein